jgi:hypothetical protein
LLELRRERDELRSSRRDAGRRYARALGLPVRLASALAILVLCSERALRDRALRVIMCALDEPASRPGARAA